MSTGLDLSVATANIQAAPIKAPTQTANEMAAKKAAKEFESVFISEFMGQMFEGISTDGEFGGGEGEAMFRPLLLDEYSKQLTAQGGFGLSQAVTRQLLQAQEGPNVRVKPKN
jgi:Rod binding domain-containing protein